MRRMSVNDAVVSLSYHPFDPEINFWVAREYDALGQTAAAISFYLRTAEYGYKTHPEHAYESLLRMSKCFEAQYNREFTVSGAILQAISLMPERPEAYLLMSRFFEKTSQWQESYTWASMGREKEKRGSYKKLPVGIDYQFEVSLEYQLAVVGYWIGRQKESIDIFAGILDKSKMVEQFVSGSENNLRRLNVIV